MDYVSLIYTGIVVLAATWVYLDATKHQIGRVEGAGRWGNFSAIEWAIYSLVFWIVFLPTYLIKRGTLIERAATSPVAVKGREGKAAAFAVLTLGVAIAFEMAAAVTMEFVEAPACDDKAVVKTLTRMISTAPGFISGDLQYQGQSGTEEVTYDEYERVRFCRATAHTSAGSEVFGYKVTLTDPATMAFLVELVQ